MLACMKLLVLIHMNTFQWPSVSVKQVYTPRLNVTLQEASDQGINVSFVALSPLCGYLPGDTTWSEAAADAADETAAVQQAELALFAQALSGSDNAQLQQMNPGMCECSSDL